MDLRRMYSIATLLGAFSVKDWRDYPSDTSTPITAAALEDLETRLSAYTDSQIAGLPSVPTLTYGTYTPTETATTNLDSITAQAHQYLRLGNSCTVSGYLAMDATAAAPTSTEGRLSLPVASSLANDEECCGLFGGNINALSNYFNGGKIIGEPTTDLARLLYLATVTSSQNYSVHWTYRVI